LSTPTQTQQPDTDPAKPTGDQSVAASGAPTDAHAVAPVKARQFWTRPGLLACVVAVVIVYGSLIPFDFAWSQAVERAGGRGAALLDALHSPTWTTAAQGESDLGMSYAASDLLMNLLLYLPLGVTLRMTLRAWRKHWAFEIMGTAVLCFVLSWGLESLQGLMPARSASINDVLANTVSGFAAALVGPVVWGVYKRLSFACYCLLSPIVVRLRRWRDYPGVAMAIALVNALLIGLWYLAEVKRSEAGHAIALPFERAYELPYDMGAFVLGRSLLVYAGIGCLLLLLTYTGAKRLKMNWVVLGVVLLAFVAEFSRAVTQNAMPDITGPLLALSAGGLMTVTVYTFSLAVRRSNRRRQQRTYQGQDRRRLPHEYS